MKIRSKPLYQYLLKAGVLNGPEEAIAQAKLEYRKQYKWRWKQHKRARKEIRIELTLRQFEAVRKQAVLCRMRHTQYARHAILAAASGDKRPVQEESLSEALQLVSMAAIMLAKGQAALHEVASLVEQAEQILLTIFKETLKD